MVDRDTNAFQSCTNCERAGFLRNSSKNVCAKSFYLHGLFMFVFYLFLFRSFLHAHLNVLNVWFSNICLDVFLMLWFSHTVENSASASTVETAVWPGALMHMLIYLSETNL